MCDVTITNVLIDLWEEVFEFDLLFHVCEWFELRTRGLLGTSSLEWKSYFLPTHPHLGHSSLFDFTHIHILHTLHISPCSYTHTLRRSPLRHFLLGSTRDLFQFIFKWVRIAYPYPLGLREHSFILFKDLDRSRSRSTIQKRTGSRKRLQPKWNQRPRANPNQDPRLEAKKERCSGCLCSSFSWNTWSGCLPESFYAKELLDQNHTHTHTRTHTHTHTHKNPYTRYLWTRRQFAWEGFSGGNFCSKRFLRLATNNFTPNGLTP